MLKEEILKRSISLWNKLLHNCNLLAWWVSLCSFFWKMIIYHIYIYLFLHLVGLHLIIILVTNKPNLTFVMNNSQLWSNMTCRPSNNCAQFHTSNQNACFHPCWSLVSFDWLLTVVITMLLISIFWFVSEVFELNLLL